MCGCAVVLAELVTDSSEKRAADAVEISLKPDGTVQSGCDGDVTQTAGSWRQKVDRRCEHVERHPRIDFRRIFR